MVSCYDKRRVNLRLECAVLEKLKEIEIWKIYLDKHWYTLKYLVKCLHAVYRLLYKILSVFGSPGMCSKLNCHNLIDGLRPISQNMNLFNQLVVFTQIQMHIIGSTVETKLCPCFQDTLSKLFYQLTVFLHRIIWIDNCTSNVFRNSLPIKLNFI